MATSNYKFESMVLRGQNSKSLLWRSQVKFIKKCIEMNENKTKEKCKSAWLKSSLNLEGFDKFWAQRIDKRILMKEVKNKGLNLRKESKSL